MLSFPRPTLGARPFGGCRLPDAILHGKRSLRPRSRAVQCVAATGFLSEASWPAWAGGCATGLRTWARHVCEMVLRVSSVCAGSATAFGSALAPCHGSDLLPLRLPFARREAVPFLGSPPFWECSIGLAWTSFSPRHERSLCPAFRRLWFGRTGLRRSARTIRDVLAHSSNRSPSG
jgi:hypothetical protein